MGYPVRTCDPCCSAEAKLCILLLCVRTDQAELEVVREMLEVEGHSVRLESALDEPRHFASLLAELRGPALLVAAVSPAFDRWAASPSISALSQLGREGQRLLVLDLRRRSMPEHVALVARAVTGLERIAQIGDLGGLTASACRGASASGAHVVQDAPTPLRVVQPRLLLQEPLLRHAVVVPAGMRHGSSPRRRSDTATRPELPSID